VTCFIVAEALTNVVKHARATLATVRAAVDDGVLVLEVRGDGVGGADPEGHSLMGIADRVDAERHTRASPASAAPASSGSSPNPSTGPIAPVPCSPPVAAVCEPHARRPAVRS